MAWLYRPGSHPPGRRPREGGLPGRPTGKRAPRLAAPSREYWGAGGTAAPEGTTAHPFRGSPATQTGQCRKRPGWPHTSKTCTRQTLGPPCPAPDVGWVAPKTAPEPTRTTGRPGGRGPPGQAALGPIAGQSEWALGSVPGQAQAAPQPSAQPAGTPHEGGAPDTVAAISRGHPARRLWVTTPEQLPFTADHAMASGTFNPLSRVLFTLRSLYNCALSVQWVC